MPIADPASFDWAGKWIAVIDGSDGRHAIVMFGSPSGVWLDPANAHTDGARIVAGWMLTPLDLQLPTQTPYGTAAGVGTVTGILIAPVAEAPLVRVDAAVALPGRGLAGDRYAKGDGTFSGPGRGYELTLVEAEVLDEIQLSWEDARRNIVTTGISLNALVGKRFHMGRSSVWGGDSQNPAPTSRSLHALGCCGRSSIAGAFEPTSSPGARSRSATRSPSASRDIPAHSRSLRSARLSSAATAR